MKTLVVYDSFFGNTKQIADVIASKFGCDSVKYSDVSSADMEGIDLLIVGSPIRGWRPTDGILKFLRTLVEYELNDVAATSFDTRVRIFFHGDAKNKIARELQIAGVKLIGNSEAFYVNKSEGPLEDNELEKAARWADKIKLIYNGTK